MTMLVQRSRLVAVVLAFLAIVACSPMKDPAEAAIADATAALQKIGADGPKYAPAEYKVVTDQVDSMKASFDKKEYEAVLNTVRQLIPNMKLLAETVADKKRQANIALRDQWSSMSRDVPTSLAAVEARVAELSKAKKLPKGVSKDAVAGAGSAVDAAKQSWSDAQSAKTSGNVEDAVAKGKATQATLTELMASLGMSAGGTAAKK